MIELNGVRDALATLTATAPQFYQAPGRLTLVGDELDYSEGFILPIAVDRTTVFAAAPRNDRTIRASWLGRDETSEFSLDETSAEPQKGWFGAIRRIAAGLERHGITLRGADLAMRTTIPAQAGLAACASLRVAVTLALVGTAGAEIALDDLLRVCRDNAGEAAPIASATGRRGHALLIDCRSAQATTVPFMLAGAAVVVCDPQVNGDRRPLERQRRDEYDAATTILRMHVNRVQTLRDISLADFLRHANHLPPTLRRRTRHVVTENVRVLQTVAAVRAEDSVAVGGRMNESHDSLRDDYDASSAEIDVLVSAARAVPGVFGSRMSGRGKTTVSLVRREALPALRAAMTSAYRLAFGREPVIFEVRAADGASRIG